jgi:hypothetical protein
MLIKLLEIQRREDLTDGQMAARLGISRPTWNLVKNGKRPFRDDWAVRAVGQWPELTRDLLELAAAGPTVSDGPAQVATEPIEVAS